jgi:ABC-type branched-subunit amino acid transport system substrate-binding protein
MGKWVKSLTAGTIAVVAVTAFANEGVTDKEIVMGSTGAMSGPIGDYGVAIAGGAEIYFNKINKAGGINGRTVKFIPTDDGYDPQKAVANVKDLVENQKVMGLIGGNGSPIARAIMPYVVKEGIPYLFPVTGASEIRTPIQPTMFHLRTSFAEEAEQMMDYAVKKLKAKKVGVFMQDDAFGQSGLTGVNTALDKHKMRAMWTGKYTRNTEDVSEAVKSAVAEKPDVIYLQAAVKPAALFIKQVIEAGHSPVFMANSIIGTLYLDLEMGKSPAEVYISEVFPLPSDKEYKVSREFMADLKASGKEFKALSSAFEGYIGAMVFAEAAKRAGKNLSRQTFLTSLEGMKNFDVGGLKVSFSKDNHQGLSRVLIYQLKNGAMKKM